MDNKYSELLELLEDVDRIKKGLDDICLDKLINFEETKTNRGFKLLQFSDDYDTKCDIQESSHIEPHIWLGTNSPNPKIMASKTKNGGTGWVEYEIPDDVLISHRMHLTPEQSIALGLKLLKYGLFEEL